MNWNDMDGSERHDMLLVGDVVTPVHNFRLNNTTDAEEGKPHRVVNKDVEYNECVWITCDDWVDDGNTFNVINGAPCISIHVDNLNFVGKWCMFE